MNINMDTRGADQPLTEDEDAEKDPLQQELSTKLRRFKEWCRRDMEHQKPWREEAERDFAFVAGYQWEPADRKRMEDEGKVPVEFNRVLTVVKSIAGSEINGRLDTRFLPRGVEDSKVNEKLSAASEWMADQCDAEDEQSEAFEGALICGMGWTEARFTYDNDPEGMYVEEEIDGREMYWDCNARKKNLSDARRRWRLRSIPLAQAVEMFPDEKRSNLDASWLPSVNDDSDKNDKAVEDQDHSISDEDDMDIHLERKDVRIVQLQYWYFEQYHLVAGKGIDPATGAPYPTEELTEEEFKHFKKLSKEEGFDFESTKMRRRRYRQAFIGNKILKETDCPSPEEFSFNCITGERDRKKGHFFGLVRVMRDPQMWANKMLTNALHIANTTAKGGIIAEKAAFANQNQAEASYAQPNVITWAAEGAIKDQRIMPKPGQGDPSLYLNILEFAISSIRDVTGVNLELLGLRDANQPGILEAQRKQAAMTVLASLFNSLRRFRKSVGRVRLHLIQEYISDGRLIRIKGDHGGEVQPLNREDTLGRYDVIVADAPTSPNQKQETWQMMTQVLPVFKDMMTPDVVLSLLEYSPFPVEIVEKLRTVSEQSKAQQQQMQAQQQQLEMERFKAEVSEIMSQAAKNTASAEKDKAQAMSLMAEAQNGGQANQDAAGLESMKAMKLMSEIEAVRGKEQREWEKTHADLAQKRSNVEFGAATQIAQESRTDEAHQLDMEVKEQKAQQEALLSDAQLAKLSESIQQTVIQTVMALKQSDQDMGQSAGEAALKRMKIDSDIKRADRQADAAMKKAAQAGKEKKS